MYFKSEEICHLNEKIRDCWVISFAVEARSCWKFQTDILHSKVYALDRPKRSSGSQDTSERLSFPREKGYRHLIVAMRSSFSSTSNAISSGTHSTSVRCVKMHHTARPRLSKMLYIEMLSFMKVDQSMNSSYL